MSIEEILHRIKQQITLQAEKRNWQDTDYARFSAPALIDSNRWLSVPKFLNDEDRCLSAARDILQGRLVVLQFNADAYDVLRCWNRDPKRGTRAPAGFGKALDYRNESLVGDIKYLWEPCRHLHLVTLAQAYCLSREDVYLRGLSLHLRSWLDQCPYLTGPHWSSSLEVAIRLINWSLVWQLIGGRAAKLFCDAQGKDLKNDWLSSIYQHMHFISSNFSRYSSANNHLIGEAAGLFIASNTWLFEGKKCDEWRKTGYRILIDEIIKQSHGDGVTREQALSYQQFVLDFFILSLLSGKAAGELFPETYLLRLEKMMEFIACMIDVRGNLPMIGDADDGYVIGLSQEIDFCPYKSLLATGSVLFRRPEFLQKACKIDDKTRWLVGDAIEFVSSLQAKTYIAKRSFPEGGYYILGSDLGTQNEIRCLIDCGPLGYLAIAAHGHADALAVYLSIAGTEFLIDPGTYCYHTQRKWREYFRSTMAHNTVMVDHLDQSQSGGNFMWLNKANAIAHTFKLDGAQQHFLGSHDGYLRLNDPVMHKREVKFDKECKLISIVDSIECKKKHVIERFWHFHEKCEVSMDDKTLVAENNGKKITIFSKEDDCRIKIYRGDEDLPAGWVSRHYDLRRPCITAAVENKISQTTYLQTDIRLLL